MRGGETVHHTYIELRVKCFRSRNEGVGLRLGLANLGILPLQFKLLGLTTRAYFELRCWNFDIAGCMQGRNAILTVHTAGFKGLTRTICSL